eukprot:CAMPEP_0177359512 /NCGR_PEP_ID=MMETSP0368-20130122/36157_1 /TAXON_ID=447022 ORGANISM="Scrippsiella hangoei-like, Strain SHHI-4" /NCGR_SAMPLE_ID=MMETSP0368 /ASSEMBLY_ACC=CAM_ASM_000363 /LENGTH=49 /DNA_ID= /DNA_START= /DNA_END= /DNA_ORIENTATION=
MCQLRERLPEMCASCGSEQAMRAYEYAPIRPFPLSGGGGDAVAVSLAVH